MSEDKNFAKQNLGFSRFGKRRAKQALETSESCPKAIRDVSPQRIKTVAGRRFGRERGLSLYLAIMIMTLLLAMALGLSSIFLGQLQTIRAVGYSVIAFYAADAGIEKVLMQRDNPTPLDGFSSTLANGAVYQIFVSAGGTDTCPADYNYCVKSIGEYKQTKRAIEIAY